MFQFPTDAAPVSLETIPTILKIIKVSDRSGPIAQINYYKIFTFDEIVMIISSFLFVSINDSLISIVVGGLEPKKNARHWMEAVDEDVTKTLLCGKSTPFHQQVQTLNSL